MNEYVFVVKVDSTILGIFERLEYAFIFIQGYYERYYNEISPVTIKRQFKKEVIGE